MPKSFTRRQGLRLKRSGGDDRRLRKDGDGFATALPPLVGIALPIPRASRGVAGLRSLSLDCSVGAMDMWRIRAQHQRSVVKLRRASTSQELLVKPVATWGRCVRPRTATEAARTPLQQYSLTFAPGGVYFEVLPRTAILKTT